MKKSLLLSLLLITAAVSVNAQARFGFTAGTVFSKYKFTYEDVSLKTDSKVGLTIGAFVDIPAGKSLSVQPALNFVQKGQSTSDDYGSYKAVINTLELPVNVVYHAGGLFIGGGPALAFAISGKATSDDVKEDMNFGDNDDDDMHAMDFGASLLAGYAFKTGFQVSGHYYAGLSNLAPGASGGKLKNSYFGIKLGYMLHH